MAEKGIVADATGDVAGDKFYMGVSYIALGIWGE